MLDLLFTATGHRVARQGNVDVVLRHAGQFASDVYAFVCFGDVGDRVENARHIAAFGPPFSTLCQKSSNTWLMSRCRDTKRLDC